MNPTPPPLDYHPAQRPAWHPVFLTLTAATILLYTGQVLLILDHGRIPWPLYEAASGYLPLISFVLAALDWTVARFATLPRLLGTLLLTLGFATFLIALLAPAFYHG